jgi:UDP-N-acetylglucosamine--N-acetylmuramyl-(pentapeptide) pyrophosphoryl-undecaprenol N-acetylglucosamine transferase
VEAGLPVGVPENYHAFPFIHDGIWDVIAAADVVVSRAGANSLSECAQAGKPLVLVPLAGAGTRGDQVENAAFFARRGAALVLDGKTADAGGLIACLESLLDPARREELSQNVKALLPKIPAADIIATTIKGDL